MVRSPPAHFARCPARHSRAPSNLEITNRLGSHRLLGIDIHAGAQISSRFLWSDQPPATIATTTSWIPAGTRQTPTSRISDERRAEMGNAVSCSCQHHSRVCQCHTFFGGLRRKWEGRVVQVFVGLLARRADYGGRPLRACQCMPRME